MTPSIMLVVHIGNKYESIVQENLLPSWFYKADQNLLFVGVMQECFVDNVKYFLQVWIVEINNF
jgi:hypothetical protein